MRDNVAFSSQHKVLDYDVVGNFLSKGLLL
jgi:hypothetical protein